MRIVECGDEVAEWLEGKLLGSLRSTNVQAANSTVVLAAKEPRGQLIGGLVASTSYGWMLVKILWVDEKCRESGVGRSLMQHAEYTAVSKGCHGAWLDTSSQEAHQFYLKLGYESFGELHNLEGQYPHKHQRWFMKKSLLPLA